MNDPMKDLLIDDIAALADVFSGVMKASYVRLRLDVVTDNACKKFHIDALTARLVCTYRGTGTQYGIAAHGVPPHQVFTVPTGAPGAVVAPLQRRAGAAPTPRRSAGTTRSGSSSSSRSDRRQATFMSVNARPGRRVPPFLFQEEVEDQIRTNGEEVW